MANNRVINRPNKSAKKRKRSPLPWIVLVILVCIAGGAGYWFFVKDDTPDKSASEQVIVPQNLPPEPAKSGTLKIFSGEEFRDLYNNFAYPNTEYISDDAIITGDLETDMRIIELAEKRGYVRRSAPVHNTFREVEQGMKLQERASQPWLDLQAAAKADGINLHLTAAFRSAEEQRDIFLSRLGDIGVGSGLVASGNYDAQIDEVLAMTAIPGYSRHHTGYTIDIGCTDDPVTRFDYTACFEWLSAENYKNAKRFGWIPSYPEGAGLQGPEPETWEYVWVGMDSVTE